MRDLKSQLTMTAVAILLGVLVVVQLRAQSAGSSLDSKSLQDLTALIAQLNTGNDDLRTQLALEKTTLAQLQSDLQRGQSAANDVQGDLNRVRGWAGLDAITGPGVRIALTGNLPADAVQDVVNEVWSLGADGVAVGDVRMVPGVVVSGSPGKLTIERQQLGPVVEITVVGDRDALSGGLRRAGGVISELSATYDRVSATILPLETLTLPATDRSLTPPDGRPHL